MDSSQHASQPAEKRLKFLSNILLILQHEIEKENAIIVVQQIQKRLIYILRIAAIGLWNAINNYWWNIMYLLQIKSKVFLCETKSENTLVALIMLWTAACLSTSFLACESSYARSATLFFLLFFLQLLRPFVL